MRRAERVGVRAGETLLYTLEERRNQITQKATVSGAAATGVIVVSLQFVLAEEATTRAARMVGFLAVIAAAVSLIQSLNIVRALGRRQVRDRSKSHLLYFGTITELGAAGTTAKLASIDENGYLQQLAAQAASLAHNLRHRYASLARSYRWVAVAIVLLSMSVGLQQIDQLDGTTHHRIEHPHRSKVSTTTSPTRLPATRPSADEK